GHWLDSDLRALVAQDLIERHSISDWSRPDGLAVATLSKNGQAFGMHRLAEPDQAFHRGVLNPKEGQHDTALYRVYHAEVDRIESRNGRVHRVLLDAELRHHLYTSLNRPDTDAPSDGHQHAVASAFGLTVVDGVIQYPDLRLEYESVAG